MYKKHLFLHDGQGKDSYYRFIDSFDDFHEIRERIYEESGVVGDDPPPPNIDAVVFGNTSDGSLEVTHDFLWDVGGQMYRFVMRISGVSE